MNLMQTIGEFFLKYNVLLNLLMTFIGGVAGYWIKNYLDKKKELTSEITKERRESYQNFINLIINVFANVKKDKETDNLISDLYEFYKKNILYASPDVINNYANYMQYLYSTEGGEQDISKHLRKLTKVMKAMRKDLGLKNDKLGKDGEILMRAIIKDFDKEIR